MTQRRRYTRSEKAEAVGMAVMAGAKATSERTGIPRRTIDYWANLPEFADLRTKTREDVADQMWAAIQMGVQEVAKGILGDAPLRDKATALGILYDKHALLTGSATARTESRDITGTLSDADLIAALHEAERLAAGEGDPQAIEGASAGEL